MEGKAELFKPNICIKKEEIYKNEVENAKDTTQK